jgi:hypothetical protein
MAQQKVMFARIGHMHFYSGPQDGDEKPKHGGAYNRNKVGHEAYNFRKTKKSLYGYIQPYEPPKNSDREVTINLERISPSIRTADTIKNVLIIFVARSDIYGQVIVGWYNSATVYRYYQDPNNIDNREFNYNLKNNFNNATLLPQKYRSHKIPAGKKGSFGRANVVYLFDEKGIARDLSKKQFKWIKTAIDYVQKYEGPNLLTNSLSDAEDEIRDIYETSQVNKSGQGFKIDPKLRKEIEKYSVKKAITYYKQKGYSVKDVGAYKSFDLECTKRKKILRVEVKGTQTTGDSIILTRNEVRNAKNHNTALYILHSIKVKKLGRNIAYHREFKGYLIRGKYQVMEN